MPMSTAANTTPLSFAEFVAYVGPTAKLIGEIGVLAGVIIWFLRIVEGLRCMLRDTMLNIYYRCEPTKTIRQYEAMHFEKCYLAYKALLGNTFIDEIRDRCKEFKVIVD